LSHFFVFLLQLNVLLKQLGGKVLLHLLHL
jgi:hypothetical protein